MTGNKPRIFVSSTIYDFRDLRSALKFWFEQFGFEVILSDKNDFPQNPNSNSYDSCLQAIDSCDYFLLLVGGRAGGWFDKDNKITITRKEYQYAYERFLAGRLQLLPFVRKEVWDIREDRRGLRELFASDEEVRTNLTVEQQQRILNHVTVHTPAEPG